MTKLGADSKEPKVRSTQIISQSKDRLPNFAIIEPDRSVASCVPCQDCACPALRLQGGADPLLRHKYIPQGVCCITALLGKGNSLFPVASPQYVALIRH